MAIKVGIFFSAKSFSLSLKSKFLHAVCFWHYFRVSEGLQENEPLWRLLLPLYRFQRAARRHISAWNPWDHRVSDLSTGGDEKRACHSSTSTASSWILYTHMQTHTHTLTYFTHILTTVYGHDMNKTRCLQTAVTQYDFLRNRDKTDMRIQGLFLDFGVCSFQNNHINWSEFLSFAGTTVIYEML